MAKRKGELTNAQVDRDYPHQVIILAREVCGPQGGITALFMANANVAPRTHSVREDNEWYTIYCFADESHADQFIALFGGERFDPKTRGRGATWAHFEKRAKKTK
jgi:hypothetical protein